MADSHIIKRQNHTEPYDERKLYASIYASCVALKTTAQEAELIAAEVTEDVEEWLEDKPEVTAHDIRVKAAESLKLYKPDAAYLYKTHKEIC